MMIPYGQRVTPDDRTTRSRGLMRPRPTGRALRIALAGLLAVWFALPLLPLLLWSVANRWSFPAALPTEWGLDGLATALAQGAGPAFGRSVLLGLAVAAIATPLGALAARALTLGIVPAPRLMSALLLAPLALPAFVAVMGLTVLLLRARVPAPLAVLLLLVAAALPYTVYTMRVAYAAHDIAFEEEARTLGASPLAVLLRVHLPLVAPGLARAAFLAFLVGWSDYVVTVLVGGGTLYLAGNGGSAADAQHVAAEYVVRFRRKRRPFAAMALTTDTSVLTAGGNDLGFEQVFARQVEAHCRPGDLLVLHSTSGRSPNLLAAARAAQALGVPVVGFLGGDGGPLAGLVDDAFVVASEETSRIQEIHLAAEHAIADLLDEEDLG